MLKHLDKLERAIERDGGYTLGDVLRAVQEERAQWWESDGAVIVSQVHDEPRRRVVHLWFAAGDLEEVIQLSGRVQDWARSIGCTRATLTGRKGWMRVLESEGWGYEQTLMGREI